MAGYTRQSIADIINGSEVTAPPLNAEFNQMAAAFNGATGHSHDGSTGNAPKIDLATSVSGYLPAVNGGFGGKNNFAATTNPLATDDAGDGYAPGSMWENTTTGRVFICVGNTSNAAVWRELVQVQTANKIIPEATDTVDLGEPSTRFQDLWLSGGLSAFGNGSLGGTLTVTGATALGSTLAVTGDATFGNLTATGTTVITSVDLNSGAIDNAAIGTTTPAAGTFTTLNANTSLTAATADINGGTIDGATIGATSHTTGKFTTLQSTGQATLNTVDINGGNIDGTVIGAVGTAAGSFTTLSTSGQGTFATVDINGGSIDGTAIGNTTASSGAFTTLSATGGITGDLTGAVVGNVTGNVTGDITGDVAGDLTGNVTSSGTSTFNNVTIDGTLNMNAGTTATITNLTSPTNTNDAATKGYVDTQVANLVDSAPGTLDTLNELAAALGDDADFSTTVTDSIATKLPLAGGTMTGAIAMSTNKITGAGDPTAAQDVATKAYVDTQDGLQVTKSGDTMSGNLAMGSNKVTGLAAPTDANDATSKTYVDGILGSATAAAASAAAAATSESNAATSETNASNSASAASTSEANAAASYDSFDDRYLGAKATAPTVDNDGDALIVGALYFNNTTNIMYVYGSGGWQAAGSSVNGTSDRNTYTATAGQTVFAATYDTGYVDVYLNGVKLVAGTDFTATNGTSITLATGAAVNDVVDIVAYGTFVLADHYTEAQSDARYVQVAGDTMTGDLSFGDNDKAIFGAGSDLQIYHDGSHSRIVESGTGQLKIQGTELQLYNADATKLQFQALDSGEVSVYYNNSKKLATTSTGIDVTGTVTSDGVSLDYNTGLFSADKSLSSYSSINGVYLNGNSAGWLRLSGDGTQRSSLEITGSTFPAGEFARIQVANSEAMRINSNGSLLIGQSLNDRPAEFTQPTGASIAGASGHLHGQYQSSVSGLTMLLNRKGSHGQILALRKDGADVGSIGSSSSIAGNMFIAGTGSAGLQFRSDDILPTNGAGSYTNGSIDLGDNGARFRNGHFSGAVTSEGGVYIGGSAAANLMDSYEEGIWMPTVSEGSATANGAIYTKIGRFVNVKANLQNFTDTTSGNNIVISGLPFGIRGTDQMAVFGFSTSIQYSESAFWQVQDSDNTLQLRRNVDGGNVANISYANITSSSNNLYIDVSYMTD